jgi:hypothetical protein
MSFWTKTFEKNIKIQNSHTIKPTNLNILGPILSINHILLLFIVLQMLFEEFPAIIVLNIETAQVVDTGLEAVLFHWS